MLVFGDLHLDRLEGFPGASCCLLGSDIRWTGPEEPFIANSQPGRPSAASVFNGGLLLVNARRWREDGAYQRFLDCLRQHQVACPYFKRCEPNDQCALNMAFAGRWRALDVSLNAQKVVMHTPTWSHAIVRHYTGRNKFLPLRPHRCDRREYALLCAISREADLPHPGAFYDGGFSYWLNGLRRRGEARRIERALAPVLAG